MKFFFMWFLLAIGCSILVLPVMDTNRGHEGEIVLWYAALSVMLPMVWFRWLHPYSAAAKLVIEGFKAGALTLRPDLSNPESYYFNPSNAYIFEFAKRDEQGRVTYFILGHALGHGSFLAQHPSRREFTSPPRWESDVKKIATLGDMEAAVGSFVVKVVLSKHRKAMKQAEVNALRSKVTNRS